MSEYREARPPAVWVRVIGQGQSGTGEDGASEGQAPAISTDVLWFLCSLHIRAVCGPKEGVG